MGPRENAVMRQPNDPHSQQHASGEADQRRLHSWPDWDESVRRGRRILEFDPNWAPGPCEQQSPEYRDWRARVERRRLLAEANRALIELHLPDLFREYWIACFLAPYERDGFRAIRDPQPDGSVTAKRVFPPPLDLWFAAGIDYSMAPATLVIEGPAALASTTILRAAVSRAMEAKQRSGFVNQHPLLHARQVGPVAAERAAARLKDQADKQTYLALARQMAANGDAPKEIAHGITGRGYSVSTRTVRRWLEVPQGEISDTPS